MAATEIQHFHPPYQSYGFSPASHYSPPSFDQPRSRKSVHRVPHLETRPWSDLRDQPGAKVQSLMSEQPQGTSSTSACSTGDGGPAVPSLLPDSRRPTPLQRLGQARELPPPPPRPSRSASFSNILNPDDGAQRQRKVPELDSPQSIAAPLPSFKHGRQSPATTQGPHGAPIEQRRILTPKSPSLHRAASMGQLSNPTGSIDAQQSPFLNSRTYTAEPGAPGVPPLPRGYPPPSPSTVGQRTCSSTQDIKTRSPSVSPKTSYVPQYVSVQNSPASSALPSLSTMSYSTEHMANRDRPMSIPISSAAGQNVYQMMTLQTSAGAVQVPVDVQAASRVADEKRRRNAGASARFRARRKEKEKESTSTISKLEMQVKDLTEDVEFYRRERGYLMNIVMQVPGGDRHFPRPQSPRHRRVSYQPSTSGSGDYLSGHEMSRSPGDGRNVRRRTSTLSMPVPPTAGPAYTREYEHQQYHPQPLPGPASLLPPMQTHPGPIVGSAPASATWQSYNREHRDPHAR